MIALALGWVQPSGPATIARLGFLVNERRFEFQLDEDFPDQLREQIADMAATPDADLEKKSRADASQLAARAATLLREARACSAEHAGHGCSSEIAFGLIADLLSQMTAASAGLLEMRDVEQIDLEPLLETTPRMVTLLLGPLRGWLEQNVDDEEALGSLQMFELLVQQEDFAHGDEDGYETRLEFGPLPEDTVERMHEIAVGERSPGDSPVADRLGAAIAALASTFGSDAAEKEDTPPPRSPPELTIGEWAALDADDDVYVQILLINKPAGAFDACGLTHQLQVLDIDHRIEDEWSLSSTEQLLVSEWHRGMSGPLVRRAIRNADGEAEFLLGQSEFNAIYQGAPDIAQRDRLIADYFVLEPSVGAELDDDQLTRLTRLSAALQRRRR